MTSIKIHVQLDKSRLYGLIPKNLSQAVRELGVPKEKADEVANKLVILAHTAMAGEYNERCSIMARELHYRRNYREHVMGIKPPHHPPGVVVPAIPPPIPPGPQAPAVALPDQPPWTPDLPAMATLSRPLRKRNPT